MENNYYHTLNANENESYEDLKAKYKKLILQYHPDKKNIELHNICEEEKDKYSNKINTNLDSNKKYLEISEAWNTLKDEEKRKKYDAQLFIQRNQHLCVYQNITIKELKSLKSISKHEDEPPHYLIDCRCGGEYIFDESEVEEIDIENSKIILECNLCSLVVILQL